MRYLYLLALATLLACSTPEPEETTSNDLPNIVYILADDLGYGDLGAYNPNSKIPTPNLNQFASQGMRFTDAHSPSSVCTPTRYGILTGRYCWRSPLERGVSWGYGRTLIDTNRVTVADLLQQQGYHTAVVGKWHLGLNWGLQGTEAEALADEDTRKNENGLITHMHPDDLDFTKPVTGGPLTLGFDYSFILPASLDIPPYVYLENDELLDMPSDSTQGSDLNTGSTGAFWRPGRMMPGFEFEQVLPTFVEKAQNYIEQQASSEQPFFLYLPLAAPHTPWVPTAEYQDTSAAGQYGDFVAMVDAYVGRVLQTLDKLELSENTLVIFTSDNGPHWKPEFIERFQHKAAGNLRGMKADAWEGGHRVPFIVRWPEQVLANSESNATTTLTSFMATVADLTGAALPNEAAEDSHSLLPVLLQQSDTIVGQEAIIHHSSRGVFAIRKGDWKLIEGRGSGGFSQPVSIEISEGDVPGQLYNLRTDPDESENVYADFPEKVEELSQLLEKFKTSGRTR